MIEVACIASAGYVRHAGAMLDSMLASTRSESVSITLLHLNPIDTTERQRLQRVTDAYGATLTDLHVEQDAVAGLPLGYFSPENWLTAILPELLPGIDKVLFLDSDLIVTDDLRPLWNTELEGHLLAAVTGPLYPFMRPYPQLDLGIERPEDYFNSGVLLMDLNLMRREGTVNKVRAYAHANPQIPAADQDTLNVVCKDRWLKLHPRWNVQTTMFDVKARQLPFPASEVTEALESPAVIHFIGPSKPWHYLCAHPRRQLYFSHARATPWGEPAIDGRNLRNAILRRLPVAWTYRWGKVEHALRSWRSA